MRHRQAKKILKRLGEWPSHHRDAAWYPSLVYTPWPRPLSRALVRNISRWANQDMRRNPEVRSYFPSATFAVAG